MEMKTRLKRSVCVPARENSYATRAKRADSAGRRECSSGAVPRGGDDLSCVGKDFDFSSSNGGGLHGSRLVDCDEILVILGCFYVFDGSRMYF